MLNSAELIFDISHVSSLLGRKKYNMYYWIALSWYFQTRL